MTLAPAVQAFVRRITLCGWVLSLELLELCGWVCGWVLSFELLSGLLALARSLALEKSLVWPDGSWWSYNIVFAGPQCGDSLPEMVFRLAN
jgi:hypothetical protein